MASLGGLAGIAIGYGVVEWFHTKQSIVMMTDLPVSIPFRMDTRVLLASIALTNPGAAIRVVGQFMNAGSTTPWLERTARKLPHPRGAGVPKRAVVCVG